MHMHVNVCVCWVYVHVHVHENAHVRSMPLMYVFTHACMYYACMLLACMHVSLYACMRAFMQLSEYVCTYA